MNKKQKAPADVAASVGAKQETEKYEVLVSKRKDIMEQSKNQATIYGILPRGKENAITTVQLMKIIGLTDKRKLQHMIRKEREGGALIASKSTRPGGYYVPADREELLSFERTCNSRAVSTLAMLKETRRALAQIDGQLKIDGQKVHGEMLVCHVKT